MALGNKYKIIPPTYFHFPPLIKLLRTPLRSVFLPLHFNKFLEDNLSKSPSFSQLLPVVIPSWYHTIPSVPMIQDVKWKSLWYINPLTSRTTVSPFCSHFKVLLTLVFIELISNTNTLGIDLNLIG